MAKASLAELLAQSERDAELLAQSVREKQEILAQSEREKQEILAQSEELKATIRELTRRLQENSNQFDNFGSPTPSDDVPGTGGASSSDDEEDEISSPRITGGAAVNSFLRANGEINRTLGTAGS
jgi:hypothetical protein